MSKSGTEYIKRRRRFSLILLLALGLIAQAAFFTVSNARQEDLPPPPVDSVLAADVLEELEVKERVPRAGYTRDEFSPGWASVKGCDMRNRILQRDLSEVVLDDDGCTVLFGVLEEDPFTGKRIVFQRGPSTSRDIHIEHLVAVSDAWQKGAQDLEPPQRHSFYNDPLNLVAVDGPANMEKGDKDAASWLPQAAYKCRYVARQIAVKVKYLLWVTQSEYNAMRRVLSSCPHQVLPVVEQPSGS